ncbi:MAG: hypothetical protein AAF441_20015, partial [Pseudomonadota bacterium]
MIRKTRHSLAATPNPLFRRVLEIWQSEGLDFRAFADPQIAPYSQVSLSDGGAFPMFLFAGPKSGYALFYGQNEARAILGQRHGPDFRFAFASNSAYREVAHCQEPLVETIGAMVMGRGVNYDRLLIPVMIGDRP